MASEKRLMTHYSSIREATLELKKFYKAGDLSNSLEICKALEKVDPKNKIAKKSATNFFSVLIKIPRGNPRVHHQNHPSVEFF